MLDELGAAYRILDLRAFPNACAASLRFAPDGDWAGSIEGPEVPPVDLGEVTSVWWRRPQGFELDPALDDAGYQLFALGECEELFGGLWPLLDARWVNDPKRDEVAHKKPFQLRVAQRVGLPLPDTLMTNDPQAARAFIDHHGIGQVIYKSFSATHEHWRETRLLKAEEADDVSAVRLCPVIFQALVPAGFDVRVTIVDGQAFAAAIVTPSDRYQLDFRMNMNEVRIRPYTLPPPVAAGLERLMQALGLVYGAADFRVTPEGEHLFLEVNPAGQWLFVEDATGQPIARRLAETLAAPSRSSASLAAPSPATLGARHTA